MRQKEERVVEKGERTQTAGTVLETLLLTGLIGVLTPSAALGISEVR